MPATSTFLVMTNVDKVAAEQAALATGVTISFATGPSAVGLATFHQTPTLCAYVVATQDAIKAFQREYDRIVASRGMATLAKSPATPTTPSITSEQRDANRKEMLEHYREKKYAAEYDRQDYQSGRIYSQIIADLQVLDDQKFDLAYAEWVKGGRQ